MQFAVQTLVILLPLVCGCLFASWAFNPRRALLDASVWGYGLVFGALFAACSLRLLSALGQPFATPGFLMVSCATVVVLLVLRRVSASESPGRSDAQTVGVGQPATVSRDTILSTALVLLLLALSTLHFVLAAKETMLRPMFGWDATMHWATKAKVWFDQGTLVPFVDNERWLELPGSEPVFTDHHAGYPAVVPLLQVWMGIAAGGWSESRVNSAWPLFMLALGLIVYGQGRLLGVARLPAAAFAYMVISLPMVGVQVALAGYADLPLAACYTGAVLSLISGHATGNGRHFVAALLLAFAGTQIKDEGFFWALCLLPACFFVVFKVRTATLANLAGLLVGVLVLWLFPRDWNVAGHSLESLRIAYVPDALSMIRQEYLSLGIWHLSLTVIPAAFLAVVLLHRKDELLLGYGASIAAAILLYLFLFTWTRFSYGALQHSAATRIALHLMPSMLAFAMLVWQRTMDRLGLPAPAPSRAPVQGSSP